MNFGIKNKKEGFKIKLIYFLLIAVFVFMFQISSSSAIKGVEICNIKYACGAATTSQVTGEVSTAGSDGICPEAIAKQTCDKCDVDCTGVDVQCSNVLRGTNNCDSTCKHCSPAFVNKCDTTDGCGGTRSTFPPYNSCDLSSDISCRTETLICNDGYNNDCDATLTEFDYDTLDRGAPGDSPTHGDSDCPITITLISVSSSTPVEGTWITATCTSDVANVNSIIASIDGSGRCTFTSWSSDVQNNAQFNCNIGSSGTKTVRCSVDSSKSYQASSDKTTSINVIPTPCSDYTSIGSCDGDSRCDWCPQCGGSFGRQSSGGSSRCVNAGLCSFNSVAGQCGATCDANIGCPALDCDNQDGCSSGTFRDYFDVTPLCSEGLCSSVSCDNSFINVITDSDMDGFDTQCDSDCNDNDAAINPGLPECCVDQKDNNCNGTVDEASVCDKDGDGVVDKDALICPGLNVKRFETVEESESFSIAKLICQIKLGAALCKF